MQENNNLSNLEKTDKDRLSSLPLTHHQLYNPANNWTSLLFLGTLDDY
jgi:hypothetical protein